MPEYIENDPATSKVNRDNMIELMGLMVEFRNPENRNKVKRIKGLTKIFAKCVAEKYPEYGLTERNVSDIAAASLIHDIGEMAIPDSIVNKPGRLTDEEYEYMKSHTLRGIEVLGNVNGKVMWGDSFDTIVKQMVRSHHEKYNGSGYPDGLKGDDIPIAAQIMSLVDSYDALVNDSVYRKAYPKDVAFNKIIVGDCGQFPPKMLECFKECREKFEAWENGLIEYQNI